MAENVNNPKILERLREEIDSVVGKTRLVQETDLPREFEQGCKVGGFYIPEGTSLFINVYAVMRDPDEFNPERFLGEEKERRY